jgi:hypothetical protein
VCIKNASKPKDFLAKHLNIWNIDSEFDLRGTLGTVSATSIALVPRTSDSEGSNEENFDWENQQKLSLDQVKFLCRIFNIILLIESRRHG